jgi:hypothetical protein
VPTILEGGRGWHRDIETRRPGFPKRAKKRGNLRLDHMQQQRPGCRSQRVVRLAANSGRHRWNLRYPNSRRIQSNCKEVDDRGQP